MMYLHYCHNCRQIFMLSGHQHECLKCGQSLQEMKLHFNDYVNYSPAERMQILSNLSDEQFRVSMQTKYRFSKRTKRYREWTEKMPLN